uniref:Ependymin n=1 Tax=Esox lucius TaxID=8010 RepID=A0AAY5K3M7_ESOLU
MQAFAVAALSIWLCLGATTLAESHGPQHCTSPNMTGVLTVMALNGGEIKATGHYHYDTTDKKLRFTESEMHLNKSEHLEDYLMLFEEVTQIFTHLTRFQSPPKGSAEKGFRKVISIALLLHNTLWRPLDNRVVLPLRRPSQGVFYDIDLKNQSCRKMSLQSHAHALELPAGAVHQVELFLGSDTVQEENIKVNIWMGSVPETKGQYSVSTTVGDCLPLSTFYSTDSITLLFSNSQVVTEVKEPEVFSLPSFCEGLELEDTHNDFFSIFNTV